jgi:hypothetical protein
MAGSGTTMTKLQYDPRNPSPTVLRQAVFARLRMGWPQVESADFNGRKLREGFDQVVEFLEPSPPIPHWEDRLLEAVYSLLWQLVTEGVIHPGSRSLNFPHITVTEYGKRVIENDNAHPHDVERFLDQIRRGQQLDPTVEAYLVESLHSFRQNRLVASAILLGVAAERTFLLIAEALLEALKNPTEQSKFQKVLDRQVMKPKQDWVHTKLIELDGNKRQLPDDFPESTPLMITGVYDLIRQQRNDLGHPRDIPPRLDRGQLEANLFLFSRFYRNAEDLRLYLTAHKASL